MKKPKNATVHQNKSLPSFSSFKANRVLHSKSIDRISFGCSPIITFKNTDDFIYFRCYFGYSLVKRY